MSAFTESIEHYCKGLTVSPGAAACCDECRTSYGCDDDADTETAQQYLYENAEPYFSGGQCDSCGSTYAGDRDAAHGIPHDFKAGEDTIIHMTICTDCVLFHANGDEPEEWYQTPGDYREASGY